MKDLPNKLPNTTQSGEMAGKIYSNLTDSDCQISDTPNFTLSWIHFINRSPMANDLDFSLYFVNGVYEIEGEHKFTLSWFPTCKDCLQVPLVKFS